MDAVARSRARRAFLFIWFQVEWARGNNGETKKRRRWKIGAGLCVFVCKRALRFSGEFHRPAQQSPYQPLDTPIWKHLQMGAVRIECRQKSIDMSTRNRILPVSCLGQHDQSCRRKLAKREVMRYSSRVDTQSYVRSVCNGIQGRGRRPDRSFSQKVSRHDSAERDCSLPVGRPKCASADTPL